MEKLGLQMLVLLICTGTSLFNYAMEGQTVASPSTEFVLVKEDQGIELYERWYKMKSGKLTREVKAVCTIKTSVGSATSLLQDESKASYWNKGTSRVKIIAQKENSWLSYIQYKLPWPMENQDCVLQNTRQLLSNDFAIVWFNTVEHDSFPEMDKTHRIPYIKGRWIFKQNDSQTRTEYFITTTPSTILPRQLTDPIIRQNLINTIASFRSLLEN